MSSDGAVLAVGAPLNEDAGWYSGHVRVYQWDAAANSGTGGWAQLGGDIDGDAVGDRSGERIALSSDGTILAIGAFQNDGTGSDAGHVRVYKWSGSSWAQHGSDIDGEVAGDQSGLSVAMNSDGTIIAVGAPYNDGTGDQAGHVRVYQFNEGFGATVETQSVSVTGGSCAALPGTKSMIETAAECEAAGVTLGAGYEQDGDWCGGGPTGCYRAVANGKFYFNHADYSACTPTYGWLVCRDAEATVKTPFWQQLGPDIDGEAAGDNSGYSVALNADGTILAAGANLNDGTADKAGHVRVFRWDNGAGKWTQLGSDIDGEAADDRSGNGVALNSDGTILAVTAPRNDGKADNAGHARVYEWTGTLWRPLGGDIDGEAAGDQLGFGNPSLSADGTILAVGAQYNDGNGANSGHARIYQWLDGAWTQLIGDLDGELAGDTFGSSVALSGSGNRVAVGAIGNDGKGDMAGHVRVYELVGRIPPPVVFYSHPGVSSGTVLALSNQQLQGWNGFTLEHDWAMLFTYHHGGSWTSSADDDGCVTWFSEDASTQASGFWMCAFYDRFNGGRNSKIGVQWKAPTNAYESNPRFDFQLLTGPGKPFEGETDLQFLFSYNKDNYDPSHSGGTGGDDDPALATTPNGPGLSFYYRLSSDGGTTFGAWTQLTSAGVESLTERSVMTWPASMTGTFGARDSSGTETMPPGSSVKDIYLLTKTMTPEEVAALPPPAAPAVVSPTPFYSHAGVTNGFAVIPNSEFAGWKGWDPAHDWSFSFKAYRGTWSQGSFFAFANDVTTPYSATSASHWHRSASLDIAGSNYYMYWASDSVDHRMKPMAVTSDTYVEMLFAYDSSAYAAGTSTAPDQGAGFKWYMRTASSSGALASASWSEVTTTHGADQFDRADAVTWPQNPNMALGIEKGGYRPFNSDTRQGSVTEVRLWSETLTPATLPPYA
jgi:hypothetical protein